jgi:hypothetical protein
MLVMSGSGFEMAERGALIGCWSARRIIDDRERAGVAPVLEPSVLAAVDLDQLAKCLAPQTRLVKGPALA